MDAVSVLEAGQDFVAGAIGGCAGIIAGQPLDTVKVRLQSRATRDLYRNSVDCLVQTVRGEGVRALFKGMTSPLVGSAPLNAILFASFATGGRVLDDLFPGESHKLWKISCAGSFSGLMGCVATVPTELIKCQLQVQRLEGTFRGPWDCIRQRVAALGWRHGLYQGWWITLLRDVPSYALFFIVYELSKARLNEWWWRFKGVPVDGSEPSPAGSLLLAGALAGTTSWASIYPIDMVKSAQQTLPHGTSSPTESALSIAQRIYAKEGYRGFVRGLAPTLVRATPVNAVTFLVYEMSLEYMRGTHA